MPLTNVLYNTQSYARKAGSPIDYVSALSFHELVSFNDPWIEINRMQSLNCPLMLGQTTLGNSIKNQQPKSGWYLPPHQRVLNFSSLTTYLLPNNFSGSVKLFLNAHICKL